MSVGLVVWWSAAIMAPAHTSIYCFLFFSFRLEKPVDEDEEKHGYDLKDHVRDLALTQFGLDDPKGHCQTASGQVEPRAVGHGDDIVVAQNYSGDAGDDQRPAVSLLGQSDGGKDPAERQNDDAP